MYTIVVRVVVLRCVVLCSGGDTETCTHTDTHTHTQKCSTISDIVLVRCVVVEQDGRGVLVTTAHTTGQPHL